MSLSNFSTSTFKLLCLLNHTPTLVLKRTLLEVLFRKPSELLSNFFRCAAYALLKAYIRKTFKWMLLLCTIQCVFLGYNTEHHDHEVFWPIHMMFLLSQACMTPHFHQWMDIFTPFATIDGHFSYKQWTTSMASHHILQISHLLFLILIQFQILMQIT